MGSPVRDDGCTSNMELRNPDVPVNNGFDLEYIKMMRFYASRPSDQPASSRKDEWESVYSCDSAIEKVDGNEDDDSDPYDLRIKEYLDTHLEEMGYPGKDPLQLYADSKIAEVLARGTITEGKSRKRLKKLKKALPNRRIITPDFSEANKIIEEIEAALEKKYEYATASEAFDSLKAMIETEFDEKSVRFDMIAGLLFQGSDDVVEVRKLAREILGSELEGKDEDPEDEIKSFAEFLNSRILFPQSTQEYNLAPSEKIKELSQKGVPSVLIGSENTEEKKCPEYPDSEDEVIAAKKMILTFKKQIYKVLLNHVTMIKNSKNLVTFELFRIWNKNQELGLVEMAQDIVRREHDLRVTVKKLIHSQRMERLRAAKHKKDACRPVTVPEKPDIRSRTKNAIECIRKREKLLRAKQDLFFLAGVINGKIQCKKKLFKMWREAELKPGMPPRPPHGNVKVIDLLKKCKDSKKRLMTYGDMLRLLQQEGEFIPIEPCDGSEQPFSLSPPEESAKPGESLRRKIIANFINEDAGYGCPLVTKREYENYLEILNELFLPDPNFKWINETISFNPYAFACEKPRSLDMSYSLERLEKDAEKVFGHHGHLTRVVYFFQYKAEYAAVDIQDAYERFVYENNAMDLKSQQHPFGCLLLYSNVAQGIAMVEGKILHVFNHFAGFRYSPIHKMIKTGRILYIREKVSRHYFRKWVSIVVTPPVGVMTYLTTTKKILNRVAEPRLYHFKEKLDRFYRVMSHNKLEETYMDVGENSLFMAPNPLLLFESCCCHTKKEEGRKRELHVPVMDLLPSPALVAYLLKYRSLKSFNRFLDEFLMQPELESEDETFNIVENSILSNYVESDEEEGRPELTKEIKRLCREKEVLGKLRKELHDNMVKDTKGKEPPEWTKEYDIHSFNPQLVKVQVRETEGQDVIRVDELADTEEEVEKLEEERFVDISYEADRFEAQRRFVNFVQTGSEAWQKKIKRFGLPGSVVKEMLQDAKKYKKLQKVMKMLAKQKVTLEEYGEAEDVVPSGEEEVEFEEEGDDKSSSDSDVGWVSAVEGLEEVLAAEEPEEFMGEQLGLPFSFKWGEGPEFFGEGKFDEHYGEYPKLDWDWKSDVGRPIDSKGGDQEGVMIPLSESSLGESKAELLEGEENIPDAPPASSVTHSSTDP